MSQDPAFTIGFWRLLQVWSDGGGGTRRREFKIDWDTCAADKKSPRPSCFQSNTLGTEYFYEWRQLLWLWQRSSWIVGRVPTQTRDVSPTCPPHFLRRGRSPELCDTRDIWEISIGICFDNKYVCLLIQQELKSLYPSDWSIQ
jgi:hypothetical protein